MFWNFIKKLFSTKQGNTVININNDMTALLIRMAENVEHIKDHANINHEDIKELKKQFKELKKRVEAMEIKLFS